MRIFNVLEEGVFGGPQRRSVRVAAELLKRRDIDATTTLIIPLNSSQIEEACAGSGVQTRQLPMATLSRHKVAAAKYVLTFFPQVIRLAALLRRERPDVIHVSGGSFCWKGPLAARLAGVPFAWHLNDTQAPWLIRSIFRWVVVLTRPAHIIYAAYAVREYYGPLVPEHLSWSVVPAPFGDRPEIEDLTSTPDPYESNGATRVLLVANVSPVKGIDFAIEALRIARESCPDMVLYVAGNTKGTQTAYHDGLKEQAGDLHDQAIVYLGYCPDVRPWLEHATISLCSSRAEASPLAVWEAAAAGKPMVSADVGDVARELPNDEAALIVPVGDVAAMAKALVRLAKDAELQTRLGTQARQNVASRMSVSAVADASLESYRSALAGVR